MSALGGKRTFARRAHWRRDGALELLDPPPGLVFWLIPLGVSGATTLIRGRFGGWFGAAVVAAVLATLLYIAFVIVTVGYSPTGTSLVAFFTFMPYLMICGACVALLSFAADGLHRSR